jgi:hypothetical protein
LHVQIHGKPQAKINIVDNSRQDKTIDTIARSHIAVGLRPLNRVVTRKGRIDEGLGQLVRFKIGWTLKAHCLL